jgi:hypothetical protein
MFIIKNGLPLNIRDVDELHGSKQRSTHISFVSLMLDLFKESSLLGCGAV